PSVIAKNNAPAFVHLCSPSADHGPHDQPVDHARSRNHSSHSHAICCFSYGSIGLCIASAVAPEPVAFASTSVVFQLPSQVTRSRFAGTVGTRAPPERA